MKDLDYCWEMQRGMAKLGDRANEEYRRSVETLAKEAMDTFEIVQTRF